MPKVTINYTSKLSRGRFLDDIMPKLPPIIAKELTHRGMQLEPEEIEVIAIENRSVNAYNTSHVGITVEANYTLLRMLTLKKRTRRIAESIRNLSVFKDYRLRDNECFVWVRLSHGSFQKLSNS